MMQNLVFLIFQLQWESIGTEEVSLGDDVNTIECLSVVYGINQWYPFNER
jgi:hypothetical protein